MPNYKKPNGIVLKKTADGSFVFLPVTNFRLRNSSITPLFMSIEQLHIILHRTL
jgi:hypothetical protein